MAVLGSRRRRRKGIWGCRTKRWGGHGAPVAPGLGHAPDTVPRAISACPLGLGVVPMIRLHPRCPSPSSAQSLGALWMHCGVARLPWGPPGVPGPEPCCPAWVTVWAGQRLLAAAAVPHARRANRCHRRVWWHDHPKDAPGTSSDPSARREGGVSVLPCRA